MRPQETRTATHPQPLTEATREAARGLEDWLMDILEASRAHSGELKLERERRGKMISKTEVVARVDEIASRRLFSDPKWLVDGPIAANVLDRTLQKLGLVEPLSGGTGYQNTNLGRELNIDLQLVFMGLFEPWDAIHILEDHNLVSDDEIDTLFDLLEMGEQHYEHILRARVQQAYRDYFGATRLH